MVKKHRLQKEGVTGAATSGKQQIDSRALRAAKKPVGHASPIGVCRVISSSKVGVFAFHPSCSVPSLSGVVHVRITSVKALGSANVESKRLRWIKANIADFLTYHTAIRVGGKNLNLHIAFTQIYFELVFSVPLK